VRGRWDNCGRFVGPLWQSRPKTERQGLTINGLATEELDFKGMHIQLLYQEAGKQMQGDPYNVDGWPRERVKLALLILINASSHRSAVLALADALKTDRNISDYFKTAEKLLRAVKARHKAIAWAFGSDAGVRLMHKDARIAEAVMLEALRVIGLVPLCV